MGFNEDFRKMATEEANMVLAQVSDEAETKDDISLKQRILSAAIRHEGEESVKRGMDSQEKGIVEAFREKTEQCFHKIGDYSPAEIEEIVLKEINGKLRECDLENEIKIIGLAVAGSRSRGFERENSDLDVVFEFQSDTWREDDLFNLLHEDAFSIEGVTIDINPIKEGKSGTLEGYLLCAEKYLAEKEKIENEKLLRKAEQVNIANGTYVMVFGEGDVIALPAEYDDEFSDHERNRLLEIYKKNIENSRKVGRDFDEAELDEVDKDGKKLSSSLDDKMLAAVGRTQRSIKKGAEKDFCL